MWVSQQDLCKDLLHVAAVHHIVGGLDYVAITQDSLLAGLNLLSIDPAAVTAIGVLEVEPASCVVKMLKKWTKWKKTAKNGKKWQKNCQNLFQAIYNHNPWCSSSIFLADRKWGRGSTLSISLTEKKVLVFDKFLI